MSGATSGEFYCCLFVRIVYCMLFVLPVQRAAVVLIRSYVHEGHGSRFYPVTFAPLSQQHWASIPLGTRVVVICVSLQSDVLYANKQL